MMNFMNGKDQEAPLLAEMLGIGILSSNINLHQDLEFRV